jgi:hypothetical protein
MKKMGKKIDRNAMTPAKIANEPMYPRAATQSGIPYVKPNPMILRKLATLTRVGLFKSCQPMF